MTKIKRKDVKYPALDPRFNLRTRIELIDYDYLHKLSPKELAWLNKFQAEEVNADFRHPKPLNKTVEEKRVCYRRNNARNRCILTKVKAVGGVVPFDVHYDAEEVEKYFEPSVSPENNLIEILELSPKKQTKLKKRKNQST